MSTIVDGRPDRTGVLGEGGMLLRAAELWRRAGRGARLALLLPALAAVTAALTGAAAPGRFAAEHERVTATPSVRCDAAAGGFEVVWTIANWLTESPYVGQLTGDGTLTYRTSEAGTPAPVPSGWYLPGATGTGSEASYGAAPGQAWLVQRVPGTATKATFSFLMYWQGVASGEPVSGSAALAGPCPAVAASPSQPPAPAPSPRTSSPAPAARPQVVARNACDGSVLLTLSTAGRGAAPVAFSVRADGGFQRSVTVPGAGSSTLTVPAATASGITVRAGTRSWGPYSWARPEDCARPVVTASSDCDLITITIANTTTAAVTARVVAGDEAQDVTVSAGAGHDLMVAGADGLVATVTIDGQSWRLPYAPPAGCVLGHPTHASADRRVGQGRLAWPVAAAAVLLVTAAGLVVLRRRRGGRPLRPERPGSSR